MILVKKKFIDETAGLICFILFFAFVGVLLYVASQNVAEKAINRTGQFTVIRELDPNTFIIKDNTMNRLHYANYGRDGLVIGGYAD